MSRLPFHSAVDHVLSELFSVTICLGWLCTAWLRASLHDTSPIAWSEILHGVTKSRTQLNNEQQQYRDRLKSCLFFCIDLEPSTWVNSLILALRLKILWISCAYLYLVLIILVSSFLILLTLFLIHAFLHCLKQTVYSEQK